MVTSPTNSATGYVGGPRFVIQKPTTVSDDGSPSESIVEDMNRVVALIQDERHMRAEELLNTVKKRISEFEMEHPSSSTTSNKHSSSSSSPGRFRLRRSASSRTRQERHKEIHEAKQLLEKHAPILIKLQNRCRLFRLAKRDLNVNDDWTLAQTLFGVTTYYRREDDDSLSIKLEGRLEGVPLFEQVAILREVDLHSKWAPFVSSSLTVAHLDKLDTVGWFVVGLPNFGLMRDGCFRAIGCDCIAEDGSIVLVGQGIADRPEDNGSKNGGSKNSKNNGSKKNASGAATSATGGSSKGSGRKKKKQTGSGSISSVTEEDKHFNDMGGDRYLANDPLLKDLDLPAVPTKMGSGRMTIRKFQAVIHVDSPTSARTLLIANIDPNLSFLPQSLLEFVMKKMCGVLLSKLQSAAKRIGKDPVRNPHARKMRLEREFYHDWLMPKFQATCDVRGWTMPPVAAFNLTPQQVEQAQAYEDQQRSKSNARMFHSLNDLDKKDRHVLSEESGHSSPGQLMSGAFPASPHHSLGDSDSVSALSMNSSTTSMGTAWRNNPLATYLKDLEDKIQCRKDEEISKSRQRAAKRLKPKVLDPAKQARLAELRAAKERRRILEMDDFKTPTSNGGVFGFGGANNNIAGDSNSGKFDSDVNGIADDDGDDDDNSSISSYSQTRPRGFPSPMALPDFPTDAQQELLKEKQRRDLAIVWTQHGVPMRFFVTSTLVAMLFSALYKESLFGIAPRKILFPPYKNEAGPWYAGMARDAGTIGYMSGIAVIHSCLCYVVLMYAFSALQLGTMAGRRAKKFYSENVHLMVALTSGSMVLLGVIKALLLVIIRVSVWHSVWFAGFAHELLVNGKEQSLGYLAAMVKNESGKKVLDLLAPIWGLMNTIAGNAFSLVYQFYAVATNSIWVAVTWVYRITLASNSAGRSLERLALSVSGGAAHSYFVWIGFVNDVVDRYEGKLEMHSWREDAFNTTRTLLSYSAVFLVTLLILFNFSAQNARSSTHQSVSFDAGELVENNSRSTSSKSKKKHPSSIHVGSNKESSKEKSSPASPSSISIPRPTPIRTRIHTFDAIEEEPSQNFDAEEEKGATGSVPGMGPSVGTPTSSPNKKKRRGFRLRRRKRTSNEKDGETESQSRRRTHSL